MKYDSVKGRRHLGPVGPGLQEAIPESVEVHSRSTYPSKKVISLHALSLYCTVYTRCMIKRTKGDMLTVYHRYLDRILDALVLVEYQYLPGTVSCNIKYMVPCTGTAFSLLKLLG